MREFKSREKRKPGVHQTHFEVPDNASQEQLEAARRLAKRQKYNIVEKGTGS